MLIKMGNSTVINVTAISKVLVREKNAEMFNKAYSVVLEYEDLNKKPETFTLDCGKDLEMAFKVKNEIVAQAREVENENISQALESAIKGSGNNG